MLLLLATICFAFISITRWRAGLFLFFLLLHTYLIRFSILSFPSTWLELMLGMLVISWLYKERKELGTHWQSLKELTKQHRSLVIATTLFLLGAASTLLWSTDVPAAVGELKAFYIEPVIFATLLFLEFRKDPRAVVRYILMPILALGFVTALLAIYQHFTGWMVPWDFWENRDTYRVTGWYGFPNGVGLFLAPLIPLSIYLAIHAKQRLIQILSIVFVLLAALAIVYAKSTGAIIGTAAAIGILFFVWKKTRVLAIIAGIIGVIGFTLLPMNNPIKQEILAQDRSGQIRVEMWGEAVQYLSEHPVTGAGLASYQQVIYPYRIDKWIEVFHHPHNIILSMWMNTGLLGLIGFLWIIVWFLRVNLTSEQTTLPPFVLATMICWLIMGLVDTPYIKNDWSIFFWTILALQILVTKKQ